MFNNYIVINSDGIIDINGFTFFMFKYFLLFLAFLGLIKTIKWICFLIKIVKSKYKRQNKTTKKQQIEKTPNLKTKKMMALNLSTDSDNSGPKTSTPTIPKFTESVMGVATAAATAASVYMDYKNKKVCPKCSNK